MSLRDEVQDLIEWARETAKDEPAPAPKPVAQKTWKAIEGHLAEVAEHLDGVCRSNQDQHRVTSELAADVRAQALELRLRARRLSYSADEPDTATRGRGMHDASEDVLAAAAHDVELARDLLEAQNDPTALAFEHELDVLGEMLLALTERVAKEAS